MKKTWLIKRCRTMNAKLRLAPVSLTIVLQMLLYTHVDVADSPLYSIFVLFQVHL